MYNVDVIVIGGGHAGIEAAYAASRTHVSVLLLSPSINNLGMLSCNPSIGGIGKGHIVTEIQALGGLMGQFADKACIHFRMLNRSKGPAVWGPRMQVDRFLYQQATQNFIKNEKNIQFIQDQVQSLKIQNGFTVVGKDQIYQCKAVIVATGTFLGGKIIISKNIKEGGRINEGSSNLLLDSLKDLGIPYYMLKTGTPPRLRKNSLNLEQSIPQWPEETWSFSQQTIQNPQIPCFLTYTNVRTHRIIQQSLNDSAVYSGTTSTNVGPRYCPSLEDKIVKFPHKESHQVFLEPEGLDSSLVYPSGISNSLPPNKQEEFIHTISGLEKAVIDQYGYAVEYACIESRVLDHSLMIKNIPGLFTAGQINGTTGYEEAAGQGIIAGFNAGFHCMRKPVFHLSRTTSYIGVMVDDLVTTELTEPYRMFTSRAEYRLSLRYDNALDRLFDQAEKRHIYTNDQLQQAQNYNKDKEKLYLTLSKIKKSPHAWQRLGLPIKQDGIMRSVIDVLTLGVPSEDVFASLDSEYTSIINNYIIQSVSHDAFYYPYAQRQLKDIQLVQKYENISIPKNFIFTNIFGLSNEMCERLSKQSPSTLHQAIHTQGITPAAMVALIRYFQQTF